MAACLSANVAAEGTSPTVITVETDGSLPSDSYKIYEKNGTLHLAGGQTYSALLAVRQLTAMLNESETKGTIFSIPSGYEITGDNSTASNSEYHMTWSDEFSSIGSNWRLYDVTHSGVNGKNSLWSPSQVSASDGIASIKAAYDESSYYGAQISTEQSMSYKYGYAETRVYIPTEQGLWPGFWARDVRTNGSGKPPYDFVEIDAFERFGKKDGDKLKASVLGWSYDGTNTTGGQLTYGTSDSELQASIYYDAESTWISGVDAGWHIIGFEWTETYVKFICDGEVFYTFDYSNDLNHIKKLMQDHEVYLLYSLYVGINNDMIDKPDENNTNWNEQYKIDWVHLYQKDGCTLNINNKQ